MILQTCVFVSIVVTKPDDNSLFSIIDLDNFNLTSARRRITSTILK
jgi:hypothetical protein